MDIFSYLLGYESGKSGGAGVDPYYMNLAEAVIQRSATPLSGDPTTLSLRGFKFSSGNTLARMPSYALAGFDVVENIIINDTFMVDPYAFRDCTKLKILDLTVTATIPYATFFGGSLDGCSALEAVIIRDGGGGVTSATFQSTDLSGNDYGGVGANDTFYVYVPAAYYDAVVAAVDSASNVAVPASRYRKLEDYPAINFWNKTCTVNFYDGDKLVDTKTVKYGQSASSSYTKDGYAFLGWNPSPVNVTEDMDCYGTWSISLEQSSWETIAEISEAGNASSVFKVGDEKTFTCNGYTYTAEIAGFGVDERSDGNGMAGITFVVKEVYRTSVAHTTNAPANSISLWSASTLRTYCNGTLYNGLQAELKSVVKPVKKFTYDGKYSSETTVDYCWPLSVVEAGGTSYNEPSTPSYKSIFPNNTARKKTTASGSQTAWHLRSVDGIQMSYYVSKTGAITSGTYQRTAYPFVFGFCV